MREPLHLVDTTMFWSPTGGGVRRYVQTKHDWLASRPGIRHTISVPQLAGSTADAATLPSMPLPASGGYRLPTDRAAIARVLTALKPDLIEVGDPYRVAWGTLDAARSLDIPAVAYCHSNLEAMARLAGGALLGDVAARLARRYARHLYRRFDLVLAPSRAMAAHLLAAGVPRVAVQPLGVDIATFHPSRANASWRAGLGLDDSARVLVYAGRFAAEKHLDVLCAAVAKLGAPYHLVAVGAGPRHPQGERVHVLPFVASAEGLAEVLASADLFVHAGDQETFGLSVLEAFACGTPAVVRGAEGLAELVDAGTGIAVDSGSPDAFAAAIAAMFDRDVGSFAAAARARAEASDWQVVLPGLLDRYRGLIDSRSRRAGAAPAAKAFA